MRSRLAICAIASNAGLLAWGLPGASLAAAMPSCYRVVNVDLWDVLYIRIRRDHRSSAVGAIAPDHDAVIRATGPCLPAGTSPKRQWCPVEYFPLPGVHKTGFVKAYFVASVPCP